VCAALGGETVSAESPNFDGGADGGPRTINNGLMCMELSRAAEDGPNIGVRSGCVSYRLDSVLRTDLIDALDGFVRAGWPDARALTYRIADIWR
jgi:hypothetical protein